MKKTLFGLIGVLTLAAPERAQAYHWSVFDSVPLPYYILAWDLSREMGILLEDFNHQRAGEEAWRSSTNRAAPTHFNQAYRAINGLTENDNMDGALYPFRERISFGTFAYSGAIFAHPKVPGFTPTGSGVQRASPRNGWRGVRSFDSRVWPDPDDGQESYQNVLTLTNQAVFSPDVCNPGVRVGLNYGCRESMAPPPDNGTTPYLPCLMPQDNRPELACAADVAALSPVLIRELAAMGSPIPVSVVELDADIPCNAPALVGTIVNPFQMLVQNLTGATFPWPRFGGPPTAERAATELCAPLAARVSELASGLSTCFVPFPLEEAALEPAKATINALLAGAFAFDAAACGAGMSHLCAGVGTQDLKTCLCDTGEACEIKVARLSCGEDPDGDGPLSAGTWSVPARQEAAVCMAGNRKEGPYSALLNHANDSLVADPEKNCRSAAVGFVTNGFGGDNVSLAAADTTQSVYHAPAGGLDSYVLTMGDPKAAAHLLKQLHNDRDGFPPLIAATQRDSVETHLGTIYNRQSGGTYSAGPPIFDRLQSRVGFPVFEVPGKLEAKRVYGVDGLDGLHHLHYFGRPKRIDWYAFDRAKGQVQGLLFSTDWADRSTFTGELNPLTYDPDDAEDHLKSGGLLTELGPTGRWASGAPMDLSVGEDSLDRDGNGAADDHPAVRWGYMFGGEGSTSVLVEAPHGDYVGRAGSRGYFRNWAQNADVRTRGRTLYAISNGYLHAYHMGTFRELDAASVLAMRGAQGLGANFEYDDNPKEAENGGELWRYRPKFLLDEGAWGTELVKGRKSMEITAEIFDEETEKKVASAAVAVDTRRYHLNPTFEQSLMRGAEVWAREVEVQPGLAKAPTFMTMLLLSEGDRGGGLAAFDVTNPEKPKVLWDKRFGRSPAYIPEVYNFPSADGKPAPRFLTVRGRWVELWDALNPDEPLQMSELDPPTETELHLEDGYRYNAPVCADVTGHGYVTHCYFLSDRGSLVRVTVRQKNKDGASAPGDFVGQLESEAAGKKLARFDLFNLENDEVASAALKSVIYPFGHSDYRAVYPRWFTTGMAVYHTSDNAIAIAFASGNAYDVDERVHGAYPHGIWKVVDPLGRSGRVGAGEFTNACRTSRYAKKSDSALADTGFIPFDPKIPARVISPPVVRSGVVAFTAYVPPESKCEPGEALLLAFDSETCDDVLVSTNDGKPLPQAVGDGMPYSPVFLGGVRRFFVSTSADVGPAATKSGEVKNRGGKHSRVATLYWRPLGPNQ